MTDRRSRAQCDRAYPFVHAPFETYVSRQRQKNRFDAFWSFLRVGIGQ
jgi:hypothetical protein